MDRTGRGWICRAGALASAVFCLCVPGHGQKPSPLRLTLTESTELALERNRALRIARQDRLKAWQQVREARAEALPQIDLSAAYTRNWQLPTFVFETPQGRQQVQIGTRNEFSAALDLRQPLYTSGKVGAALALARLFAEYADEQARAVRQRVCSSVEIAFYDLLLARELVRVADQAQARARAHLEQAESLWRGGRVSEYDLLRARVQVAQARPDSLRADSDLTRAETAFTNLIALDPDRSVEAYGSFARQTDLPLERFEELIATATARSPDLRQARLQSEILGQGVRIVRSAARPALELNARGQTQLQSEKLSLWDEELRRSLNTGISLKVPLFDGFRTGALTARARQDEAQARLTTARLERSTELRLRRARLALREADARLRLQEATLAQAAAGLRLAESRYARGVGTYLEVLDAQLQLTRTRTANARARRDRAVALVDLETAAGVIGEPPK
jgi:HAE1 family hydrophobic/amphiphilic exporter-1